MQDHCYKYRINFNEEIYLIIRLIVTKTLPYFQDSRSFFLTNSFQKSSLELS